MGVWSSDSTLNVTKNLDMELYVYIYRYRYRYIMHIHRYLVNGRAIIECRLLNGYGTDLCIYIYTYICIRKNMKYAEIDVL